jgi:hypothetical protein
VFGGGGGGGDTIFTGGTMAAPSTVTMAGFGLNFGGGNVGFGQSTPTFNVHVEDAISSANGFKVGNSTNLRACTINTGGDIDLFDSVGTNAIKLSQGTNSFILNNLGIGLTSPSFNLEVKDVNSSGKGFRITNTTNSASFTVHTGAGVIQKGAAGTTVMNLDPDAHAYMANNGFNLGIGISAGISAKLHAKGSGITSGTAALLVQNNSGLDLLKTKDDGTISAANLSTYASDFAAGVGGLVANDIYKTSTGELRIKI